MLNVPMEIREAHKKVSPWLTYSTERDEFCLREGTPEEIKKLQKKIKEWYNKNSVF